MAQQHMTNASYLKAEAEGFQVHVSLGNLARLCPKIQTQWYTTHGLLQTATTKLPEQNQTKLKDKTRGKQNKVA